MPHRIAPVGGWLLWIALIGGLVGTPVASSATVQEDGAASVRGTAVSEEGERLVGIYVRIRDAQGNEWSTVSDDSGGFELINVAAETDLTVRLDDRKWQQYRDLQLTALTLSPGEQHDLGTIELVDGMNLRRSPRALDVTDRSLVTTSWRRVLMPAVRNATSPRIRGCKVAAQSKSALRKVSRAINWYRAMAGLDPIRLDARLNRLAQRSSVIQNYLRGESLSHDPPRSTRCWSKAGSSAAGRSNLALGANGASAVSLYMSDFMVPSVGHRLGILNPTASRFGSGDAGHYNSLYVVTPNNPKASQPPWVAWPSAGYFPYRETPMTWSLQTPRLDVDLRRARVRLAASTGQQIRAIHISHDMTTLTWDLSSVPRVGARPTRIEVTISGIKWRGLLQPSMTYAVRIVR